MRFNFLSRGREVTSVALTILLVMPLSMTSAARAASAADYDIPISELNKVKKKSPSKRVPGEYRKKKKSEAKAGEAAPEAGPSGLVKNPPIEAINSTRTDSPDKKIPGADRPLPDQEMVQIHHSPYSFVVAGKRTIIYAVISSRTDTEEINCSIRGAGGAAPTLVKMVKVDGTQFTYTATLPALSPDSSSLRYTIVAVDSLGRETRSQEFVTPVAASPVVPGWQIEGDAKPVMIEQKGSDKPK